MVNIGCNHVHLQRPHFGCTQRVKYATFIWKRLHSLEH
jgi:hypothetical protein